MSSRVAPDPQSWGGRLDALVRNRRTTQSSDSGPLTNDELAAALKRSSPGLKVSGAYLSALRTGRRSHPSTELQLAIADHFGVPVSYFFDGQLPDESDAVIRDQLDELGVRSIALRAVGLDDVGRSTVLALLDHVRELQGLPPVDDEAEGDG
ncbi:helix-turn-helix domain-containing protein [Flexivirga meconopsidis]|uniref:helix-turn-helix domain-containing protein n=1 Tax=Flexivirga meconopsidis TaxID=2977121 RepID=UPI002240DF70|nr:helix-turn-helix domain-containing protein [Flexivirga meconopsidis]